MKSVTAYYAADTASFVLLMWLSTCERYMLRPLIRSATTGSICVDCNVIGVRDQLDVRRRCWNVGQIVIKERWRQNSTLYHSCFYLYALRFLLPKMNFGSSVLHIVVEPATDCCRYVGD